MRVNLRLGGLITINGREVALGQSHALLDGIAQERSVRGAADRLGLSYRSAWGRLTVLNDAFGQPVAVKIKGHGSTLTQFGVTLREALGETLKMFEASLAHEERALERRLAVLAGTAPLRVRMAISHDPLLMNVLGDMAEIETAVVGSREAVERLLAGRADAAGFHAGEMDVTNAPPYDALFRDHELVVRPLFSREQGFMLAAGNPLSIRSIDDIARTGARFVNRQRGSGTRLWFDRLIERAHISPADIVGYAQEEFTHQAVAAVIASGAADAGMGVRAVAERFGLGFVTVGDEIYHLAGRRELAELMDRLAEKLSQELGKAVGYADCAKSLPSGRR
jgi:molybdate transport repressor ModE-like protein